MFFFIKNFLGIFSNFFVKFISVNDIVKCFEIFMNLILLKNFIYFSLLIIKFITCIIAPSLSWRLDVKLLIISRFLVSNGFSQYCSIFFVLILWTIFWLTALTFYSNISNVVDLSSYCCIILLGSFSLIVLNSNHKLFIASNNCLHIKTCYFIT